MLSRGAGAKPRPGQPKPLTCPSCPEARLRLQGLLLVSWVPEAHPPGPSLCQGDPLQPAWAILGEEGSCCW